MRISTKNMPYSEELYQEVFGMKVILWTLITILAVIENIILFPVDLVVLLIGKIAFRNDKAKFADLFVNYRWLVSGWYCRLNGISKSDLR